MSCIFHHSEISRGRGNRELLHILFPCPNVSWLDPLWGGEVSRRGWSCHQGHLRVIASDSPTSACYF